jgi:hypothetical protein
MPGAVAGYITRSTPAEVFTPAFEDEDPALFPRDIRLAPSTAFALGVAMGTAADPLKNARFAPKNGNFNQYVRG